RRILVPHDFSAHATRALRLAAGLAGAAGGRLVVLHAIVPVQPLAGVSPIAPAEWMPIALPGPDAVAQERRRLESLVRRVVAGRRRPATTCRVVIDDPLQAILDG